MYFKRHGKSCTKSDTVLIKSFPRCLKLACLPLEKIIRWTNVYPIHIDTCHVSVSSLLVCIGLSAVLLLTFTKLFERYIYIWTMCLPLTNFCTCVKGKKKIKCFTHKTNITEVINCYYRWDRSTFATCYFTSTFSRHFRQKSQSGSH